jgi:hypothetical protein
MAHVERITLTCHPIMKASFQKACVASGRTMGKVLQAMILDWGMENYQDAFKSFEILLRNKKKIVRDEGEENYAKLENFHKSQMDIFSDLYYFALEERGLLNPPAEKEDK